MKLHSHVRNFLRKGLRNGWCSFILLHYVKILRTCDMSYENYVNPSRIPEALTWISLRAKLFARKTVRNCT